MDVDADTAGLRARIARQSEESLGKLAQDLLESPFVSGVITRAFEAREHAVAAQEAALGALNIPSAADIERLTRRLRSVSQRLEGIEDGVDRLDQRIADAASGGPVLQRLDAIERELGALRQALAPAQRASKPAAKRAASAPRARAKKKPAA